MKAEITYITIIWCCNTYEIDNDPVIVEDIDIDDFDALNWVEYTMDKECPYCKNYCLGFKILNVRYFE